MQLAHLLHLIIASCSNASVTLESLKNSTNNPPYPRPTHPPTPPTPFQCSAAAAWHAAVWKCSDHSVSASPAEEGKCASAETSETESTQHLRSGISGCFWCRQSDQGFTLKLVQLALLRLSRRRARVCLRKGGRSDVGKGKSRRTASARCLFLCVLFVPFQTCGRFQ